MKAPQCKGAVGTGPPKIDPMVGRLRGAEFRGDNKYTLRLNGKKGRKGESRAKSLRKAWEAS